MASEPRQQSRRAWLWAVPAAHYPVFEKTQTFAVRRIGRAALQQIRNGDLIFAYLSGAQVIAGMYEAVGTAFEDATPLVRGGHYPHRLRVRPVMVLSEEDRVPYAAFHDRLEVTREYDSFRGVVQQVIHALPRVDEKVLEFLVRARQGTAPDLEKIRSVLDAYHRARQDAPPPEAAVREAAAPYLPPASFEYGAALEALIDHVAARGFVYAPWQIAAYVTALRTKPFVILAGVTGTGKSKLPALVAAATGGAARLVPVRPDWTDSAEVLGYVDLQGRFRPGVLLHAARDAAADAGRHHTIVLDEMNLARVEHYFAEVLSRLEDRHAAPGGGFETAPLLEVAPPAEAGAWAALALPSNLALVGTVNMDESAHGFSRKVLDRAFTLELAEVDLAARLAATGAEAARWPVAAWQPRALRLADLGTLGTEDAAAVERAVAALAEANRFLGPAQLQAAYRTRDEIALFVLHAADSRAAFRTRTGEAVDPLDLALHMKVLPRLQGGSRPLRHALRGLLGWATTGDALEDDEAARAVLDAWDAAGRPPSLPHARFPRTAARLALMWERLLTEGFTAFWV